MTSQLAVAGPQEPVKGELHGFVENMPFEEYAKVPALNGSSIVHMRRSPMYFKYMRDNPQPETDALRFGKITHRMILEPHLPNEIAVWRPEEGMKVRSGGKWKEWQAANAGKTIMTEKEYQDACRVSVCALSHEPIRKYANAEGPTELSMFWRHPVTRRRYKARLDKLIPETHTIFDLKTTRDRQSRRFCAQSYTLGYHIKLALYSQGYEILTGHKPVGKLGAIESKAPHESAVYRVTPDILQQGWEELDQLVGRLDECERTNRWPAEQEYETDLLLPAWTQYLDQDDFAE